ncbi:MAG: glycosyltransferase family 9 protein [Sediminibacterium sp.]|nr:glycosyltransferase family 9 protein [Sediminibacterium sp.]MBP6144412.1 glycosyltransferase family 9 protein [Sediminibacterium sp.]
MQQKILVIQTAFIGDVVLATALLESLHQKNPNTAISILVRKGNEALFKAHPFLDQVLVWDKQQNKYGHWLQLLFAIRKNKFDAVVNVQRYAATGLWTALSGAKMKIGFDKNPFAFLFSHPIAHQSVGNGLHEIERNHALLAPIGTLPKAKPALYPSIEDEKMVKSYQAQPYLCMAPASVWFTKQFPMHQWVNLLQTIPFDGPIYLLGGPGDKALNDQIIQQLQKPNLVNMAGRLSFLASAALQKNAVLNYVNDSAPMHFASAVNAPVAAIYCSTIPDFGYGPLSDTSFIIETKQALPCRPCGLHGKKQCPLGHFNCAESIELEQIYLPLQEVLQD